MESYISSPSPSFHVQNSTLLPKCSYNADLEQTSGSCGGVGVWISAWNTDVSLDVLADDLWRRASWAGDVDILEVDALASSSWAADQVDNDKTFFAGAGAGDVDEVDVGDVDL